MQHCVKTKRADLFLIAVCFLASGLVSVYLGPDGNWDLRNYHYYNAYSFLTNRLSYDVAPAQIQSFHNPLLDIPFYLMMQHLRPILYGFIVGGLQGINIWLVYKIAYTVLGAMSETRRRLLSFAAGITGYYGAANLYEIGTTYQDNVTSLFVLGALLLTILSIRTTQIDSIMTSKKRLVASGFLLGVATGLKLVVAVYALSFACVVMVIGSTWRARIMNTIITSISIFFGAALSIGYWMKVLWTHFQSPLFPYYNKVFQSPYYVLNNSIDGRFFPRDKWQILFYPFHFMKHSTLVSEVGFRDIRFALCYLLLMLFFFMLFYKKIARSYGSEVMTDLSFSSQLGDISLFFMPFFVLSYIVWQKMFSIYRYIIPLELLSPVFILLILRYIFPFEKIFVRTSLGLFALIVLTLSPISHKRAPWTGGYFDVKIPSSLNNLEHATIIMADNAPLSYIIPFFPKGCRFVSIKNNFMQPSEHNLLQDRIRKLLRENTKNTYLLYKGKSKSNYDALLNSYHYRINRKQFYKVNTRFDNDLFLAPLIQVHL
jgi:hypothetical protein